MKKVMLFSCNVFNNIQLLLIKFKFIFKFCASQPDLTIYRVHLKKINGQFMMASIRVLVCVSVRFLKISECGIVAVSLQYQECNIVAVSLRYQECNIVAVSLRYQESNIVAVSLRYQESDIDLS